MVHGRLARAGTHVGAGDRCGETARGSDAVMLDVKASPREADIFIMGAAGKAMTGGTLLPLRLRASGSLDMAEEWKRLPDSNITSVNHRVSIFITDKVFIREYTKWEDYNRRKHFVEKKQQKEAGLRGVSALAMGERRAPSM